LKIIIYFFFNKKAIEKYSGFGINNDLSLDKDDIVGVIKKSDPCGNPSNWFVDNGLVKGIVVSSILTQDIKPHKNQKSIERTTEDEFYVASETTSKLNKNSSSNWSEPNDNPNVRNNSFATSEDNEDNLHNYVNCETFPEETEVNKHFKDIDLIVKL